MTADGNRKTDTPSRAPLDSWLIPSICKKPRSPGQSQPRTNASPRPIAHALPLRPPDPRRVLPSSPPTPPAPKPNKLTALTLKGELLVAAILAGAKRCENRSWQIAPGWYALHLGYGQATEAEENSWRKHWREPAGPARHRRAPPASRLHRRSHMHRREHQGGQRGGGAALPRRVGRRGLGARAEGAPNQARRRAQAAGDWRQGQTQHLERGRREHRGRGCGQGCVRRN